MERLNKFFDKLFYIIPGGVFGLLSVSIGIFIDILGLVISGYNIFTHSVSSLGIGPVGLFFNIGLILCGITAVIFDVYLGRTISNEFVNDKAIKITVATSVISSFSLILVGVFPISQENDIIMFLHVFFAFISLIGGLIFFFHFQFIYTKRP
ncbi:MAG: DUF998 domain-containing protein [Candidatus Hodarchaeota archaeon]